MGTFFWKVKILQKVILEIVEVFRSVQHKSVTSTRIRQFTTNPSVPHESVSSIQSLQCHTNPSIPHNRLTILCGIDGFV